MATTGYSDPKGVVLEVGHPVKSYRPILEACGYSVLACSGPSPEQPCQLAVRGECPLLSSADGIILHLRLADRMTRDLLATYRVVPRLRLPVYIAPPSNNGSLSHDALSGLLTSTRHVAAARRFDRRPTTFG